MFGEIRMGRCSRAGRLGRIVCASAAVAVCLVLAPAAAGADAAASVTFNTTWTPDSAGDTIFPGNQSCPSDTYVVPKGVTQVTITAVGGHGAPGSDMSVDPTGHIGFLGTNGGGTGGRGARVTATVNVTPGQTLYVAVATDGGSPTTSSALEWPPAGGYGGGGVSANGDAPVSGGGGGASYVTTDALENDVAAGMGGTGIDDQYGTGCAPAVVWQHDGNYNDSSHVLVVAGGGGGGGNASEADGGPGGDAGLVGENGASGGGGNGACGGGGGGGGTQTFGGGTGGLGCNNALCDQARRGGRFLFGGYAGVDSFSQDGSGAGGGGLWGGGAGGRTCFGGTNGMGGGGGGSSYAPSGATNVTSSLDESNSPFVTIQPVLVNTTTSVSDTAGTTNQVHTGTQVTFNANVSPTPDGGSVDFTASNGTTTVDMGPATVDGNGNASVQWTLGAGIWQVTGSFGGNDAYTASTSSSIGLQVGTAPIIGTQPSSTTVLVNGTATFSAAADGDPAPTVQWQSSSDGVNWGNISSDTSTTMTYVPSQVITENGKKFRAVFTNPVGSATTVPATMTVNQAPLVLYDGLNASVIAGGAVTLSTTIEGNPMPTPDWQYSSDGGSNWHDVVLGPTVVATEDLGQASHYVFINTLAIQSVPGSQNGYKYRTVYTNSVGSATTTPPITITIIPLPSCIVPNPTSTNYSHCHGVNFSGLYLAGLDGEWGDFTNANFFGANLDSTNFANAHLGGANLTGVEANFSNFNSADLSSTNLTDAFVEAVQFGSTNLTDANLTGSNFTSSYIGNANFTGTVEAPSDTTTYQFAPVAPTQVWAAPIGGVTGLQPQGCSLLGLWGYGVNPVECFVQATNLQSGGFAQILVTVDQPTVPVVTQQPNPAYVTWNPQGYSASFTAAASGGPAPTIQWQVSTAPDSGFTDIDPATNPTATSGTLVLDNPPFSDSGNYYRAVFTNDVGSTVVGQTDSWAAPLTVLQAPIPVVVSGTQIYDDAAPQLTDTPHQVPDGITLSGSVTCSVFNPTTFLDEAITPTLPAGSYTIDPQSCSGLTPSDSVDYAVEYLNQGFQVTPATITVYASGSMTYGGPPTFTGTDNASTYGLQPILFGCSQTTDGYPVFGPPIPVGPHTLKAASCRGGLSDPVDFMLKFVGVQDGFVVTPAARSTTTAVTCAPTTVAVNDSTVCTATVTDTDASPATTPSGIVDTWATDLTAGGVFSNPNCTLTAVSTGVASCSVDFTPAVGEEGLQHISAGYEGDAQHAVSSDAGSGFALTVTARSTSTSVACAPASVSVNGTAVCTATVTDTNTGSAITPTGTVDSWATDVTSGGAFSSPSCTLKAVSTGIASCSENFTPAPGKEGTQHITAAYEADTDHKASNDAGSGFALSVNGRSTSTSVTCGPASVAVNAATTCTATVSDTGSGNATTPTGTVDTWATDVTSGGVFNHPTCTLTTVSTEIASCSVNFTPAPGKEGTQHITAAYEADTDHNASNNASNGFALTAARRSTSTSVACAPVSVAVNAAAVCTATITDTASGTATTPTGTVDTWATDVTSGGSFNHPSCILAAVSTGIASCSVNFTPAVGDEGTQHITAAYEADTDRSASNDAGSGFALSVDGRSTSTSVACTPASVAVNSPAVCTATVTDTGSGTATTPTGTVDTWATDVTSGGAFNHPSCTLSSVSNGIASCSVNFTPGLGEEGTQHITAAYEADTDHNASNDAGSGFGVTALPRSTTTSVTCTPASVAVNSPAVCTATAIDTGSGTVTTPTGTVDTWATDVTSGGAFNHPTCTLAAVSAGVASCSVNFTPAVGEEGAQHITAAYEADTDHMASDNMLGPFALTATKRSTTTSVTCAPAPDPINNPAACTATVTDTGSGNATTPTGTVDNWTTDITSGGAFNSPNCTLSTVSTGVASCSVNFTPGPGKEGTQHITAAYEADTDHNASNDTGDGFALTAARRSTGTSVTCAPASVAVNAATTCTATVSDTGSGTATTPTGTVDSWSTDVASGGVFNHPSCTLSAVSTGEASCSVNFTPAVGEEGTQRITASYEADTDHTASDNTLSPFGLGVNARSTTTSVSCTPASVAVNSPAVCTATVTDTGSGTATTPTGTVDTWATDVTSGGAFNHPSCTLSPVSTGIASCSVNFTPAPGKEGTQRISAAYEADSDHIASNNAGSRFALLAIARSTGTSVTCAPASVAVNAAAVCTATVTDTGSGNATTPTGTVDTWTTNVASGGTFNHPSCSLLPVSSGIASCSVNFTPGLGKEGTQHITAAYEADTDHIASDNTLGPFTLTATKRSTITSVTCTPASDSVNSPAACTATVTDTGSGTATTPGGTVDTWATDVTSGGTFSNPSCTLSAVSNGIASCSVNFTPAPGKEGTQHVSAAYEADTDHNASSDAGSGFALTALRRSTTTSVTCAPAPDPINSPAACTATVTDTSSGTATTPTGTVDTWATDVTSGGTFNHPSCALSAVSTGVASCSVNFTPAPGKEGTQHISAAYETDTDHNGSNDIGNGFALTVTKQTITVNVSGAQVYGGAPTFTQINNAPNGISLTGTLTCGTVNGGTTIVPSRTPGSYTIDGANCWGLGPSDTGNYLVSYTGVTNGFVISKKPATLGFTGNLFWSTGSSSATTSAVTFTGLVTPSSGGTIDLTKASATFLIYKSTNTAMTAPDYTCGPVAASSTGVITCQLANVPIDNYTVIVQIPSGNAYFSAPNSDPVVLTVYQPTTTEFATGGGWVNDPGGNHGNFGFNVKYKSGTTPMGQSVYVFRANGYDYVVKSNSWTGGGLAFGKNSASFSGKCNVTVIDPTTGLVISGLGGGNFTYRVDAMQNTGSPNTYAISVYTSTGTLYHQAGTTAVQLPQQGGNIVVHIK